MMRGRMRRRAPASQPFTTTSWTTTKMAKTLTRRETKKKTTMTISTRKKSLKSRAANEQKWAARPPTARATRPRKGQTRLSDCTKASICHLLLHHYHHTHHYHYYYTSKERCFQELGYFIPLSIYLSLLLHVQRKMFS